MPQEENENAINHNSVDEQDNGHDNRRTSDYNNGEDTNDTSNDCSFHDQELTGFTGNNTVLTPEELPEAEENKNVSKHRIIDNKVNANVPVMQEDTKDILFVSSSSSDSGESSEKVNGGKSGDSPKDPPSVDSVNAHGDGVAHSHAGGGICEKPHGDAVGPNEDWKQRSTQATMKSVRVKEESLVLQSITVPDREGMSPNNVICIGNSNDNAAGSPKPSVVPSAPMECWKETVAAMVETKTQDTVAAFFTQMQANNPCPEVKSIVTELLSQMQMIVKSAEKKNAAKHE
eukprot:12113169-Ditylum_brightwellii.AAC.1